MGEPPHKCVGCSTTSWRLPVSIQVPLLLPAVLLATTTLGLLESRNMLFLTCAPPANDHIMTCTSYHISETFRKRKTTPTAAERFQSQILFVPAFKQTKFVHRE